MYIIYVNNTLPLAHEISRHFWAAYGMNSSHSISSSCAHSILFPGYLPTTHDFGAEGCSKLTKLTFESLNCRK